MRVSAGHRKRRLATREWGSQAYRSKQPFRLGLKSLFENPDLHSLGIVPEWLRRRPNILGRSLRANCLWASHLRGFESPDSCWRIAERVEGCAVTLTRPVALTRRLPEDALGFCPSKPRCYSAELSRWQVSASEIGRASCRERV